MNQYLNRDEVEDLHRRIAFAEVCSNPLNFDEMLNNVCALLNDWAQADVITLILPPEEENLEPMLHLFGRAPIMPLGERCIRDDCSGLLSELEFAHLPGEALRLRRGAEVRPINSIPRDDFMYRFWWHEMKMHGETVGILALYGYVDWVLSQRIRRLLNSIMPTLATAINNAGAIENFRQSTDRDEVTGGLNQRGVFEHLDRECARASDKQSELSCILIQIEQLQTLTNGVKAERLLQAIYDKITGALRPYHLVGRIADAEYVAILPEVSATEVEILSHQIEKAATQITLDDQPLVVRSGWATLTNGTADELLHRADETLAANKKGQARVGNYA